MHPGFSSKNFALSQSLTLSCELAFSSSENALSSPEKTLRSLFIQYNDINSSMDLFNSLTNTVGGPAVSIECNLTMTWHNFPPEADQLVHSLPVGVNCRLTACHVLRIKLLLANGSFFSLIVHRFNEKIMFGSNSTNIIQNS